MHISIEGYSSNERASLHRFELIGLSKPSTTLPAVQDFQSQDQNFALFTVLGAGGLAEFRTSVKTEREEAIDWDMRRKLQAAWDNRTADGKLRFPSSSTSGDSEDWLIVDTVEYKETWEFKNGYFIFSLGDMTQDLFGKTCHGMSVSLKSSNIVDAFARKSMKDGDDDATSRLVLSDIRDLQTEAMRIASLLDELEIAASAR
jgi:hypothetical protein